jgi:nucleotide-binding universal stress UspA family protein
MYRSILVPLDGSTLAEQALPVAAALAEWHKAVLTLAVVHPWGPAEDAPRPGSRADQDLRREEGVYLNRLIQEVAAAYGIPVAEAVLEGNSGPRLVQFARERRIDLVVASTHGYGLVGQLKVGGVARHLAHGTGASVLFIKPQVAPVRMTAHGGFGRILVALDGSVRAEAALEPATALGSREGAAFALVQVIPGPGRGQEQRRQQAGSYLGSLVRRLQQPGRLVQTAVLVGADPVGAMLTYAEEEAMELIVLTTRERGPMERAFFGSMADAAIHKSPIPVLVCHAVQAVTKSQLELAESVQ